MEREEKEELSKMLDTLTTKIDELINVLKDKNGTTGDSSKEASKEDAILERLTDKIDELAKTVKDKKIITEDKVKDNPFAYVTGAFTGGLIVGFLIGKREEGKE